MIVDTSFLKRESFLAKPYVFPSLLPGTVRVGRFLTSEIQARRCQTSNKLLSKWSACNYTLRAQWSALRYGTELSGKGFIFCMRVFTKSNGKLHMSIYGTKRQWIKRESVTNTTHGSNLLTIFYIDAYQEMSQTWKQLLRIQSHNLLPLESGTNQYVSSAEW